MKILLVIIIMFVSGIIAYSYKNRFKLKIECINKVLNYVDYYETNIDFYKENLYKINSNYNIMQENKNAKNNILILKNSVYVPNDAIFSNLFNKNDANIINGYLKSIGSKELEEELNKNNHVRKYLTSLKNETTDELKNKGELWFKIILMIGVLVSIIIW